MTEEPVTIGPEASIREAERLLAQLSIRHLPVVDSMGELVGMLSDRDLYGAIRTSELLPDALPRSTKVVEVMSSNIIQAEADDELIVIADLMVDNSIGAVPIVDERGLLQGIVSYVDILRALAAMSESDFSAGLRVGRNGNTAAKATPTAATATPAAANKPDAGAKPRPAVAAKARPAPSRARRN
jgi:acetoin utilization protein AcuB